MDVCRCEQFPEPHVHGETPAKPRWELTEEFDYDRGRIKLLLDEGWEPFSTVRHSHGAILVYFRRER